MPVTIYKAEYHVKDVGEGTKRRMLALMKSLEKQAKAVEDQLDKMTGASGRGRDASGKATKAWVQEEVGLKKKGKAAQFATDKLKGLAAGTLAAFGAVAVLRTGIALAREELTRTITTTAEFSDRMATVGAILQATAADFKLLSSRSRDLAADTRFTAREAADAEVFLARAGFEVQEIYTVLPSVLNLAAAAQLGLGQAADIASNIMQAFNLTAGETSDTMDVLADVSTNSNTNLLQLGNGMKFVGPIASGMGKDVREAAGALGVLADAGLQDSLGGTGLKRVLSELESPAKKTRDIIASLGLTLEEVQPTTNSLTDIFQRFARAGVTTGQALEIAGDRGGVAFQVLVDGADKLQKTETRLGDVEGRAAQLADQMQGPSSRAARELASANEELRLVAGEKLEPALVSLLIVLRDISRESGESASAIGGVIALAVAKLTKEVRDLDLVIRVAGLEPGEFVQLLLGAPVLDVERDLDAAGDAIEKLAEVRRNALQERFGAEARDIEFSISQEIEAAEQAARDADPVFQSLTATLALMERLETDKKIADLAAAWAEVLGSAAPAREILEGLAAEMVHGQLALEKLEEAIDKEEEARKSATAAMREGSSARQDALKLLEKEREAQEDLRDAIQEVRDAMDDLAGGPVIAAEPGGFEGFDVFTPERFDELREGLSTAGDAFDADMQQIAIDFGRRIADAFETGDIRDVFRVLVEEIATAGGAALGAATGLPGGQQVGAALGAIFGKILGGLFKRGADEAFAQLEVVGGQMQVVARTIEGDLGPALSSLTDSIFATVNAILAEFGGSLVTGEFGVKIRNEGEGIVRVFWGGVVTEFEDEAAAASFLVAKILSTSLIEGLGASVAEALKGTDFESTEELLGALNFAEGIDAALRTPWEAFIAEVGADTRVRLAAAQELGISTDRVAEAERRRIQGLIDTEAALIRSIGGVQGFLSQWGDLQHAIAVAGPAGVAELEAQLLAAGEAARTQAREAEAAGGLTRESLDDMIDGMGRFGRISDDVRERLGRLIDAGATADEVVDALVASLEGVSATEIEAALAAFRNAADANFLGQLAGVADAVGQSALAENLRAQALALSTEAQFLSTQVTIAQAHAEGILSDARHAAFQVIIAQIQDAVDAAGGFAAVTATGRRPGAGKANRQAKQAAAEAEARRRADAVAAASESMADVLQRVQDQLDGVTAEERRRLDLLALWEEQLREGLITQEEYTAGLAKLAELQAFLAEQAADAAEQLAVDATEAWAELGRTLQESDLDTQLRQLLEDALEGMTAGGRGVQSVLVQQVEAWFEDALEGADTPEAFREIFNSWERFLGSDLPPNVLDALQRSGIGDEIAAGIAAAVRAEDVAAFIAGARGVNLPDVLATAAAAGSGGRRGSGSVASAAASTSDELERLADELESFLDASERGQLEPLERQLLDIFDEFARLGSILKTTEADAESWGRTAVDLAEELGDVWDAARDSIDDIIDKIEGRGALPADTFVQSRAEFESLIAGLPTDLSTLTPDELNAAAAAAEALLAGAEGLFGEGFGAAVVDRNLLPILEQLKDLAPSEEDLLLLALEHLQAQAALQLEETRHGFSSSGAIATAVGDAAGVDGEASLLELVEIARVSGVLADTMGFIGDLTVQEVDELQATVAHLLSLTSLSDAQRQELLRIQELLQNDDALDALTGLLSNPLRIDAQELEDALALVNVLLRAGNDLAPDQLLELQAIVAGILDLEGLSESQRAALVAAQGSLGTVAAETSATAAAVTAETSAADARAAQQGTQLGNLVAIRQSIGPGNLNGTALAINNKLGVMSSALASSGHINVNLTQIRNRIGSGDVNAELRKISSSLANIERSGLSGAGG